MGGSSHATDTKINRSGVSGAGGADRRTTGEADRPGCSGTWGSAGTLGNWVAQHRLEHADTRTLSSCAACRASLRLQTPVCRPTAVTTAGDDI